MQSSIDNDNDDFYIDRINYFRNLQVKDKKFDKKKERIIWPIFSMQENLTKEEYH